MIPTSTNVSFRVVRAIPATANAVALFITEKTTTLPATSALSSPERQAAQRLLDAGVATGKPRQVITELIDSPNRKPRHLLLVGLGQSDKVTPESIRQSAGSLVRSLNKRRITSVAILPPGNPDLPTVADSLVTGLLLAAFRYEEYKGTAARKDEDKPSRLDVTLVVPANATRAVEQAVDRARIIADAQNHARTIASRSGNDINPPSLAKVAQALAREVGLTCRVLDEKQLKRLNMGGLLAVGAASANPPRLIALEYRPSQKTKLKNQKPLLVVGKAITFDSGGISIKPAEKMGRMIYDKCGALAVLGLMHAVAKLKLPVHIVGLLSSAENTLGGDAYRPGDVLRMHNGVTVEVTNTDAEGRLVLADALAWGIKTFKPAAVADLATLTGGVVIALGRSMAGVMANNDDLHNAIQTAADRAGEKIWRLPLVEEHREQMKSDRADIVNSAGREASPLQGAAFLSYFIPSDGSVPWIHIDIAGVADTEKDLPYYSKGATGWGVRTLVEWVSAAAR